MAFTRRLLGFSAIGALVGRCSGPRPAMAAFDASLQAAMQATRISPDPREPTYVPGFGRSWTVLLNGDRQHYLRVADTAEGWVELIPQAQPRIPGPEREYRSRGRVMIVPLAAPLVSRDRHPWPFQPRLSAIPDHPWEDRYWGTRCEVRLNGRQEAGVLTVDAVEGWIERYLPDPISVGAHSLQKSHGEVTILSDGQVLARTVRAASAPRR